MEQITWDLHGPKIHIKGSPACSTVYIHDESPISLELYETGVTAWLQLTAGPHVMFVFVKSVSAEDLRNAIKEAARQIEADEESSEEK